jgi:hypothetical protein
MSLGTKAGYTRILKARYASFGVAATFTSPATNAAASLVMIDLTKGIVTGENFAQVNTVEPVATAKLADLTTLGVDPGDMVGVVITLNGVQWQIRSYAPHPGPFGPELGQVYFMLEEPVA